MAKHDFQQDLWGDVWQQNYGELNMQNIGIF